MTNNSILGINNSKETLLIGNKTWKAKIKPRICWTSVKLLLLVMLTIFFVYCATRKTESKLCITEYKNQTDDRRFLAICLHFGRCYRQ